MPFEPLTRSVFLTSVAQQKLRPPDQPALSRMVTKWEYRPSLPPKLNLSFPDSDGSKLNEKPFFCVISAKCDGPDFHRELGLAGR